MEVEFDNNRLERCYNQSREAAREWGPVVAERYIERVRFIRAAENFRDLYQYTSWRLHPLRGAYAGKFAITLTGRYRLIIGQGPAENRVIIYEVTNHYGD